VLRLGVESPSSIVRANAMEAIAQADLPELDALLVNAALTDAEAKVRDEAAVALAHVDRTEATASVVSALSNPSYRANAIAALARMRDELATSRRAQSLLLLWTTISFAHRISVRLRLGSYRLRLRWPLIFYVGVLGGAASGIFCVAGRIPAATFGLTTTDEVANNVISYAKGAGIGLFQGMTGGITMGGITVAILALGWVLFRRRNNQFPRSRFFVSVLFGIVGGFLGGAGVASEIFFVFDSSVLNDKIHWTDNLGTCISHYCAFHPLLGVGFGAGIGLSMAILHGTQEWQNYIAPHLQAGALSRWRGTLFDSFLIAVKYSVLPGVLIFILTLGFWSRENLLGIPIYGSEPRHFFKLLLDATTVYLGAVGAILGATVGELIFRVGFVLRPQSN